MKKNFLGLALLLGFAGAASAGHYSFPDPVNIPQGGSVTFQVSFAGGGTDETGYWFSFDDTDLTITGTSVSAVPSLCQVNMGGSTIRVTPPSGAGVALPTTPTPYCEFTITSTATAVPGPRPILSTELLECVGSVSTDPTCTASGSFAVVVGPPPDVVVTFTPASGGTVTFPGGMPADVVTQSIAIGNTGTIGSGTVSGCVLGGADAGSFAITGGDPSTVPPATSLDLSATLGAAALNATLTCNVADSTGNSTATWTLTAPAGTVLAAPTLAANPASGTAITLPNSYGTPVSSNIVITPTGGDAGGPDASVTCSTGSAGFTVTPAGALTFTPPGGAAQNAVVGCTPGAAAITGTVTCTGTDQAGAIAWTYPVTCPAASTAPPPPTFVPATSLWSKLALFGVFAALGMLILGLRRNH